MKELKIFLSSGEASGDLHASELMKALRAEGGAGVRFTFLGGDLMAAAAGEHEEWTEMYKRMAEKAPEVCPVCDHPQAYFQLEQNNF